MIDVVDAESIKEVRERYGLSQRSFAKILGIGEASIVRYENGSEPSRANANLIRAAEDPRFMLQCLKRDGMLIPTKQRERAASYIYESIALDDADRAAAISADIEAEPSPQEPMSEVYEYVIEQEALNKQAADIVYKVIQYMGRNGIDENDANDPVAILNRQLFTLKSFIISRESRDKKTLEQIRGWLRYTGQYIDELTRTPPSA